MPSRQPNWQSVWLAKPQTHRVKRTNTQSTRPKSLGSPAMSLRPLPVLPSVPNWHSTKGPRQGEKVNPTLSPDFVGEPALPAHDDTS